MRAVGDYETGYFSNIEVLPGTSVELTVSIANSGSGPAALRTYKVNAHSGVNGGFQSGEEDEDPIGATAWIDYKTETFELAAGEERFITFTVSVPADTKPGQYISGLRVETADSIAIPGSKDLNQLISYEISVGILVPGDIDHKFELGKPDVISSAAVQIPIGNTGNYLVRPSGELTLTSLTGDMVHKAQIELGSIYAGNETVVLVVLPEQIASGEYLLSLSLTDPESGASSELHDVAITLPEPVDPAGIYVQDEEIKPNAKPIAFANVDVTLNNGGQQIPASNVKMEVMHNGELVEEYPLATNQVLLSGENRFTVRYIPAEMWESGTYTFNLVVSAVDPNGGQETILLDQELDATIEVP